ncbi:hypothetical protein DRJ12_01345 [Candidatus Acetothermia bacterium]|nr:MAG: hypothetical protein DRJ12_01345 [Candidatus Acetothermia bacterium]
MRVFLRRLWDTFTSGLLAILPIGLTVYILWSLYRMLDGLVGRNTPFGEMVIRALGRWIPGMGIYILLILILIVGLITRNFLGRAVQYYLDRLFSSVPGVRGMYVAFKRFSHALLAHDSTSFKKVVMFEYPRDGIWIIGLVTNEEVGKLKEKTGKDSLLVYAPTAPNPLSGMMLVVPREKVTYLDMPVEDALSMIISSGSALPTSLETEQKDDDELQHPWFKPFAHKRRKE